LVRIFLKTLLTIFIILLIVVFLIQTPFVQNFIRGKAENYLSRKLNTRVRIGSLYVGFPKTITLKNIYIEDRKKDTLLSAGLIGVDLKMWGLLHNNLDITEVHLADITAKITRQLPDTAFNFQFIIDAFTGGAPKTPDTTASTPMKMALHDLLLDKIRLVYKDTVTGNDVEVFISHSETRMDQLDPAAGKYGVASFQLEGLQAKVYQSQPLPAPAVAAGPPDPSTGSTAAPMQIRLGKIDIKNSSLDYRNAVNAFFTSLQLGTLSADVKSFDLAKQVIQLNSLQLANTTTAVRMGKITPVKRGGAANGKAAAPPPDAGWRFLAASLRLDGDNIRFDDDNQRPQKTGMDYAHLGIQKLTLYADSLSYSPDTTSGQITKGEMTERSGFRLTQLQTRFFYSDHKTFLQDLLLRTPGTLLQRSATLEYKDLATMTKDPAHTRISLDLPNSKIQVKDILTFAPFLASQPAFQHPADTWQVNARLKGTLDVLDIQTLQFSGIRDIRLDLSGRLLHPMDTKRFQADMTINNVSGSSAALINLLPKGTLPANIAIPAHYKLKGKLAGSMDGLTSDMVLTTSSGIIVLKGFAKNIRSTASASYDLALQTKDLDLGAILKDSVQYGKLNAGFTIKGQGLDQHTANATFSGHVQSMTYRQYTYQDFAIDGTVAHQHATLQSSINNTAIRFELKASADLQRKFPALQLDWQIDTLDLHALHFVKDTMAVKGHIIAGFEDTNPDSLQGTLKLAGLNLLNGAQRIKTDSIFLVAARKDDIQDLQLHSEMADLDWSGHYKLTETAQALQHTINKYYRLNGFKDTTFTAQDWTMVMHFRVSPLVLTLMPSLRGTDSIGARMAYNSDKNDLNLGLLAPHIRLGDDRFNNIRFNTSTDDSSLHYTLQMADGVGSGFDFHQTSLAGVMQNNHLTTTLLLKDLKGKDRYRIAGQLDKLEDGLKFALDADSLLLNYDAWKTSRDNFVRYDSAGLLVHHFVIGNKTDSLSIGNVSDDPSSPIDVRFADFHLSTLSHLVSQDSLLVAGILNGSAEIRNALNSPLFTSDLTIQRLAYKTDTVGNLAIKVNYEKANTLAADISLEGQGNDLKVKGEYATGEGRMDLNLMLGRLNLGSFGGVMKDEIESMSGALKGKLAISGTLDKPILKGNLHFDSSRVVPVISGEPLKLSNDNIEFDEDGFNFSTFRLLDSAGNKLTIDGNAYTKDYRNYNFDMSLNAGNFQLVNAPESGSRQFYGALNLDAAINVQGNMNAPKVDGDVRVNKKTNFFFVLPGSDPEVVNRAGVIRFIDKDHPGDTLVDRTAQILKARQSAVQGMEVSMNIQTDSSAIFTMVIDERTGDALTVRGRSNLVFGMDKSGKMDLTGSYEVESGAYNLSLDVLKRKFDIQRGSTITWTGDPTSAQINLTAAYAANTPSIDLIANEIAGRSQTDINKFKQKLPFQVLLKMEGELLKPKITFDIVLPPNLLTLWPDVDAKLQQIRIEESELNKQVFALLLLNRFVGDDPLQSASGGSSLGNMAFQSASQILTNQLDQLAGSLIKGVDIHFDLNNEQDFSTGNEQDYTELNVTVSKRLFSDRIVVNVGSNFDVQGAGNPNQQASNIAGDVAVDYKLTKDGRYMIRAYRKNQYEAVVEGQVVETGVSFILTFDYNRFRELFGKTREEKLQERKAVKPVNPKSSNQ
jgi:hypothetical protein